MDAPKKTLQHKPTEDLISKSLEVAAKIRDQELAVTALREELEGRWDDRRGESTPGINDDVAEAEKVVARMERDLLAQKEFLARKLKAQVDTNTRLAEAERSLAQYHRAYSDLLTSALKGFPV